MDFDASLAVRLLHVLAAAVVVGAPIALALVIRARPAPEVVESLVGSAERWQWGALGVIVATGVGNIAALGEGLPDPSSAWGRTLVAKLAVVLVLLLASAVRTFVVAGHSLATVESGRLAAWYAATGILGGVVLGLAVVLAHG